MIESLHFQKYVHLLSKEICFHKVEVIFLKQCLKVFGTFLNLQSSGILRRHKHTGVTNCFFLLLDIRPGTHTTNC